MIRSIAIVFLIAVVGFATAPSASENNVVVETASGPVRGHMSTNHIQWLGIPYAAPPVGELRWKAPRAVTPWSEVRDASKAGDGCVQGTGWDPGYEKPHLNEDCLFLNVYRPRAASADAKLPVFVWIHGGGLRGGAGYDTDPRKFVNLGNVVFVTFNYRLGALGFLAVPGLTDEDQDSVGNYGMLDQQAALRWVKKNIAKFGGNAEQITIAGQSAGGRSVCNQLVSPTNEGLFARAIHQSGGCGGSSIAEAEQTGARFAAAIGCSDAMTTTACLRSKSPEQVLTAQDEVRITTTVYGGKHWPLHPGEAVRAGKFNRVPVMIGQTHDERTQSMFAANDYRGNPITEERYAAEIRDRYSDSADEIFELYPVANFWSPTIALSTVEGDDRSCERRNIYADLAAHTPTWVYEFDEQDPPPFVSIDRLHVDFPFGATHVNELGYIFDYLRQALPFSSAQGELSDQMISYWSTFAHSGDPNSELTPDWPRYSPDTDEMMSLKASGSAVKTSFTDEHKCGFWDQQEG
ncbi:MAG: carboxylesterase family protein [Gammaproteobacteria bacterium]|nr:carboxylesterase family protein [Gammaproteobacteria bacterium]